MDHIGIDVHKRESQIYVLAEGGEIIERRIRIEPECFAAVLRSKEWNGSLVLTVSSASVTSRSRTRTSAMRSTRSADI